LEVVVLFYRQSLLTDGFPVKVLFEVSCRFCHPCRRLRFSIGLRPPVFSWASLKTQFYPVGFPPRSLFHMCARAPEAVPGLSPFPTHVSAFEGNQLLAPGSSPKDGAFVKLYCSNVRPGSPDPTRFAAPDPCDFLRILVHSCLIFPFVLFFLAPCSPVKPR